MADTVFAGRGDKCGVEAWEGGPWCGKPAGHDMSWGHDSGDPDATTFGWKYTVCWQEHEPGKKCLKPRGHQEGAMSYKEVRDALDGLYAYDTGSVDSGIHDPLLRQRAFESIPADQELRTPYLALLVRDLWFSDDAIKQGYGAEDALGFLRWLEDNGAL